jgi:hypothetical protein
VTRTSSGASEQALGVGGLLLRCGGACLLLAVQALGHLLGITLVVELEEAVEDLALRDGADRVAEVAPGGVEAVVEAVDEVVPS